MSIHHERYRTRRTRERSALLLMLLLLMALVLTGGAILAFYFAPYPTLLFGGGKIEPSAASFVDIDLAKSKLRVPEQLVAREHREFLGPARSVDLRIPWPFDPKAKSQPASSALAAGDQIILTIAPLDGGKLPGDRFDDIYKVYIQEGSTAEAGLTRFAFEPNTPYSDSELFVDETATPRMIIRCDLRPSVLGPKLCEHMFRLSPELMARLRYARILIPEWREINRMAHALLDKAVDPAP